MWLYITSTDMSNRHRWKQIDSIFTAALEVPRTELEPFLEKECGDDEKMKEAVRQLLDAGSKSNPLLDKGTPVKRFLKRRR